MTHSMIDAHFSRRAVLAGAGAAFGAAYLPLSASAAGARDPRLIVIILRGALDGLSAVTRGPSGAANRRPRLPLAARTARLRSIGGARGPSA